MYLLVSTTTSPELHGLDELDSLTVRAPADAPLPACDLGTLATLDDDGAHVWLHVESLRHAVEIAGPPVGWASDFSKMIDYARSKGWVLEDPTRVRAHVELTAAN